MASLIRLIIVLFLIICSPTSILAKEIKYNRNSMTVSEIKKKVDFKVFTPKRIPRDWTLETKTYPWGVTENFTNFRLHYFDRNGAELMVGIEQRKRISSIDDDFRLNGTKQVDINGHKGYFKEWANSGTYLNGKFIMGGLLFWSQDGTFITMDSDNLTDEIMVKIARSMK